MRLEQALAEEFGKGITNQEGGKQAKTVFILSQARLDLRNTHQSLA